MKIEHRCVGAEWDDQINAYRVKCSAGCKTDDLITHRGSMYGGPDGPFFAACRRVHESHAKAVAS